MVQSLTKPGIISELNRVKLDFLGWEVKQYAVEDFERIESAKPITMMRLAQGTDSLRLLRAFASGVMYYDPGIKLENASTEKAKSKKRSQFRVASKNIATLYETVETVEV